jgi:1,4-dihydroxy-2-naphthoate octaprenyltransferase
MAYTGGPRPLAYTALGELLVFLFFGLGGVIGSYYLQTFRPSWSVFAAASAVGLLAAAVLTVNNYRDLESDREVGKITLAQHLGRTGTKVLYVAFLMAPFALPALLRQRGAGIWLPLLVLPWAIALCRRFCTEPASAKFNRLLARTAQLQLSYGLLLALGLVV